MEKSPPAQDGQDGDDPWQWAQEEENEGQVVQMVHEQREAQASPSSQQRVLELKSPWDAEQAQGQLQEVVLGVQQA